MITKYNRCFYMVMFVNILFICACRDSYLDVKPDKKQVVPSTLRDLELLLENTSTLNGSWPSIQEIASDNLLLETERWNALTNLTQRHAYIWNSDVFNDSERNDWSLPYIVVFNANIVLEALENMDDISMNQEIDRIKGSALFFRAYAFHQLAQLFSPAYTEGNAKQGLGIPLRLSSDINLKSFRTTVQETYDRIVDDLTLAAGLLPEKATYKTNPTKAAAYGMLARVYLSMSSYEKALAYSDSCYTLHDALLDYNQLNLLDNNPIKRHNDEVIFHATLFGRAPLSATSGRIDTALLQEYHPNDLRRNAFFKLVSLPNRYSFRGSYDGSGTLFGGLATDEILLIKAECYARLEDLQNAMACLNTLMEKRWKAGEFTPYNTTSARDLLDVIINERRKELIFRGIRWSDLKRLNRELRYQKTLKRNLGSEVYNLDPNGPGYLFPIPMAVIQHNNMLQNP